MTSGKATRYTSSTFFILFIFSMYASVYNNIQPGIQNAFIALTHMIPDDPCKSNMMERPRRKSLKIDVLAMINPQTKV